MKNLFVTLLILAFLALAACRLFGDEPSVPPSRFPPMPVYDASNGVYSVGSSIVYTALVMAVEYQTNGVDGTILEYQTVFVTNYVPRYPKQLYIQPMECSIADGEYHEYGKELIIKLGDCTNGFYTARLEIR